MSGDDWFDFVLVTTWLTIVIAAATIVGLMNEGMSEAALGPGLIILVNLRPALAAERERGRRQREARRNRAG